MQFSATPYMKWGAIATLIGGMIAFAPPATAQDFTDTFSGTKLDARWTENIPVAGPEFDVNNGLSVVVPQGQAYDEWNTVDNAPRIEVPAPTGDFAVSAKLTSAEDLTGNPLTGNFHAVICIGFAPEDQIFWGAYTSGTNLTLERSGINGIGNVTITGVPVWLEVVKLGQTFHFYYKMKDADSWIELIDSSGHPVLITESKPVATLGIMQKSWADVPGSVGWSSFGLSTKLTQFGSISGKITTNGPSAAKVAVEALDANGGVIGSATPSSSGTYSIPVSPGTYTVKVVGNDNLSSAADSTKTGVAVTQGGNASADFTLQVAADLNTATDQTFEDKFTGTTLNSVWMTEIPSSDTSIKVNNGVTFSLPAGAYDWWTTANAAPKIQLPSPDGDFIATAKIKGTTDATGTAINGDNFQTTLYVRFSPYDIFHVGLDSTNKQVVVQRTGNVGGGAYETAVSGAPLWVQIRKVGTTYTFYYKINDTDSWTQLTDGTSPLVKSVLSDPIAVGLVTKSWGTTADVNGTFTDFQLEAVKIKNYGTVSGKVTTNGPNPAKASLEVLAADGTVLATVPVASDGTYSATVGEGTVTVTLIGQAVDTTKAGYSQSGVVVTAGKTTTLNLNATYQPDLNPATDQIFEDKFPGTTLNPAWSVLMALAGPTVTVNNGLKIETPSSSAYDAWSTVGNAPRIALPAPVGDFIMTGNLGAVVDNTGAALDGANYHASLFVNYGGYDSFWWGAYTNNQTMRLERAGNGIISTSDVTTPVWLQIKKIGNDYTFYYKQKDTDSWTQLADANGNPLTETVTTSPVLVGITLKTWAAISAVTPWSYFSLESPVLRFNGTLGGKITGATDPTVLTVNLADASGASAGKSSVNADGVYSLSAIAGSYTLQVIGADGSVVKSMPITVAPNTTTTQNIDLTASTVTLGDINADGKVNVQDATLSLRIAVGLVTPTADQKTAGDVNKDGKLNVQDTTLILQVAVGLKKGF